MGSCLSHVGGNLFKYSTDGYQGTRRADPSYSSSQIIILLSSQVVGGASSFSITIIEAPRQKLGFKF